MTALVALFATPTLAQEVTSDPVSPSEVAVYVVSGTGSAGLSLRADAAVTAPVLSVLPEGTSVRVLRGPVANGGINWFHVQIIGAGSVAGYSSGAYLTLREPPDSTSAASAQPAAAGHVIDSAVVTGYANGSDGGAVGTMTASGTRTHWGTVAADTRLYPFGTRLLVDGFEGTVFVVEDTGSGVHGNIFDVWFPDVPTAVRFGTQWRRVTILAPDK